MSDVTIELLKFLGDMGGEIKQECLVLGTICRYPEGYVAETFMKIQKPEDMPNIHKMSLRHRMNTHRDYKFFYFRTNEFEKLEKSLDEDYIAFGKWVMNTNSIKFFTH